VHSFPISKIQKYKIGVQIFVGVGLILHYIKQRGITLFILMPKIIRQFYNYYLFAFLDSIEADVFERYKFY